MMSSTQGCQVAVVGLSAGRMGVDMVLVPAACRSAAAGEHTVPIAEHDELLEPVRDLVGIDTQVTVEVDDGFDGHGGVGVGARAPDLLGQHEPTGVLHP